MIIISINKITYKENTLLDLTLDTVTEETLAQGITAHGKNGESIVGTSTKDSDTSDATATSEDILEGNTAYVNGNKVTGSMTKQTEQRALYAGERQEISGYYNEGSYVRAYPLADQTSGTAAAADILSGKTAYVNGTKITGNIRNEPNFPNENSAIDFHLYGSEMGGQDHNVFMSIPKGYYPNATWVGYKDPNIIPANIKSGIQMGSANHPVTGTFTSDGTITAGDVLSGKIGYSRGEKITGTLETDIVSQVKRTYTVNDDNPIASVLMGDLFPNLKLEYIGNTASAAGRYHIVECLTYVMTESGSYSGVDLWALIALPAASFLVTTRMLKNINTSYPWNELNQLDAAWIRSPSSLRFNATYASTYRSSAINLYAQTYQVANLTAASLTGSFTAHSTFTIRKNY